MSTIKSLVCALLFLATTRATAAVYNLRAGTTPVTLPDGTQTTMWGYGLVGAPAVTVPGPVLDVPPGDTTLTINLTNELTVPVSIVIPALPAALTPVWNDGTTGARANLSQRAVSFTTVAQPGQTVQYQWTNVPPGTYLYHSGTHPSVQVPMGLYGAAKHDATQGQAYGTTYDRDQVLLYSEIDPVLIAAVNGGTYGTAAYPTTIGYRPAYFMINGQPATTPLALQVNVNERLLLRVINAGLDTTVPTLTTASMSLLAEDGQRAPYSRDSYSMLLPAGKTRDALFTMSEPGTTVLFDRRGVTRFARITATQNAPVAVADTYSTLEDTPLIVATLQGVLANDTGTPITAALDTTTTSGTLALHADGSFTYVPAADFNGPASFTYHATDGAQSSPSVTVTINVAAVNDAPIAVANNYVATAGAVLDVAAPGVLGNDRDVDGDPLIVELVQGPAGGTVSLTANGAFQYRASTLTTQDVFTYRISDGTTFSNITTVAITVMAPNQPPRARNDFYLVRRNTTRDLNVIANDSDPDGAINLASVTLTTSPAHGTASSLGNGRVRYRPATGFRGFDAFAYTVRDDDDATSAPAIVRIFVW